ncbi:MAG: peroxiredoxin family protein [Polaribacter sp.]|jgi:peroxiredoxin family protein
MKNEVKNSESYIRHKVGTATGFSTPTNYFDDLEEVINAKISEEKFSKETAFKVPENYFDTIEDSILAKVSSTKKKTKIITFKKRVFKIIPFVAAASIILFIGLNSFVFSTNDTLTLETLSNNDLEYWLDANTLSTHDITTILQDDILDENEFYFTEIKNESIEEYINLLDSNSFWNDLN